MTNKEVEAIEFYKKLREIIKKNPHKSVLGYSKEEAYDITEK